MNIQEKVELKFGDEYMKLTLFQLLINLYLLEFNFMFKVKITKDWINNIDVNFFSNYDKNIEKN